MCASLHYCLYVSKDGLDIFDAEVSGKFTLHVQEHVVSLQVLPSHGTFLVFAFSGWGAFDGGSGVC